ALYTRLRTPFVVFRRTIWPHSARGSLSMTRRSGIANLRPTSLPVGSTLWHRKRSPTLVGVAASIDEPSVHSSFLALLSGPAANVNDAGSSRPWGIGRDADDQKGFLSHVCAGQLRHRLARHRRWTSLRWRSQSCYCVGVGSRRRSAPVCEDR